jgi:hypothetical protein
MVPMPNPIMYFIGLGVKLYDITVLCVIFNAILPHIFTVVFFAKYHHFFCDICHPAAVRAINDSEPRLSCAHERPYIRHPAFSSAHPKWQATSTERQRMTHPFRRQVASNAPTECKRAPEIRLLAEEHQLYFSSHIRHGNIQSSIGAHSVGKVR